MCSHLCVVCQVYLWSAEEQASHPGHPPAAVPEGSQPDCGPEGGRSFVCFTAQSYEQICSSVDMRVIYEKLAPCMLVQTTISQSTSSITDKRLL